MNLSHREGGERPLGFEIGAEQDAAALDPRSVQRILEKSRRDVQHGERLAHERQRRGHTVEAFVITWQRQVTRRSPRGGPKLGQVGRQPLLELARSAGRHQGRPRRAAADIEEEPGAIRLRAGAGERRGRGSRSACRADGCNQDESPVHFPAGLA